MTDKPLCPKCGRRLVWLSSPQVWKCFKCHVPPEPEARIPWWIWVLIIGSMAVTFALMILLDIPTAHNGSGNLTQTSEEPDTGMSPDEVKMMFVYVLIIGLVGILVAHLMERGKERCPACGEVLRLVLEVQKYKCLHCGSWYPREDIEVEVVE